MKAAKQERRKINVIILQKAEELALLKPIHEIKVEEIASAAGISKVTLYSYFRSKEEILLGITTHLLNQIIAHLNELVESHKEGSARELYCKISEFIIQYGVDKYYLGDMMNDVIRKVFSTNQGLSDGLYDHLRDSPYYQNLSKLIYKPFGIGTKVVNAGHKDGSIGKHRTAMDCNLFVLCSFFGITSLVAVIGYSVFVTEDLNIENFKKLKIESLADFIKPILIQN